MEADSVGITIEQNGDLVIFLTVHRARIEEQIVVRIDKSQTPDNMTALNRWARTSETSNG